MQEWTVPVWGVVTALGILLLLGFSVVVTLGLQRSRSRDELVATRAQAAQLQAQVDEIERRLAAPRAPERSSARSEPEFLITQLGEDEEPPAPVPPVATLEASLFADLVLRESVVRAASLAQGLRRALAPATRNRIRFEMKQEVKRSRKQRRADLRAARRDWEARQRAALTEELVHDPEESAA